MSVPLCLAELRRLRALLGATCLGLLLGACDTAFVDPQPAHVERVERTLGLKVVDVPVVYALVFDLYIPDAAACARVTSDLTVQLRSALLPPGRSGFELSAQTLSPACRAPGQQPFDLARFESELAAITRTLGPAVRPILVYFRNVNLPPPAQLAGAFSALSATGRPQPARLWGLTVQSPPGLPLHVRGPWTHQSDPALLAPLQAAAAEQLPLNVVESPSLHELLTSAERTRVLALKACTPDSRRVQGEGFALGTAVPTAGASSPRVRVTWDAQPQARGTLKPPEVRLTLELCTRDCDRTFAQSPDYVPRVWNTTPGCVLLGDVP